MRRIAIYGPPLAGKTRILQGFASKRALEVRQFDPLAGATVPGGVPSDHGLYVHDRDDGFSGRF